MIWPEFGCAGQSELLLNHHQHLLFIQERESWCQSYDAFSNAQSRPVAEISILSADFPGDVTCDPHNPADPGGRLGAFARNRPQLVMAAMEQGRDGQ